MVIRFLQPGMDAMGNDQEGHHATLKGRGVPQGQEDTMAQKTGKYRNNG